MKPQLFIIVAILVCILGMVSAFTVQIVINNQTKSKVATSTTSNLKNQNQPPKTPVQTNKIFLVQLDAENDSNQAGSATVEELPDKKTKITINLTGKGRNEPQPAHIHLGSCPKPGAIKYNLNDVLSNYSETTLNVDLNTLLRQAPIAINVHKSSKEPTVYTSCGNFPKF